VKYIRLKTNKQHNNVAYNTIKKISINIYFCGLVWFGLVLKKWSENWSDPSGFYKTTSKRIQKYSVFCGFRFFWIGLRFYFGSVWIWTPL